MVWKSDMWFGYKVLRLKATVADGIHYCQLGKMAVVTRYSLLHGNEANRTNWIGHGVEATGSQDWLVRQIPGERIGKVAGKIAAADLRAAAVNDRRANPKRRQQPGQLGLRQWQTVRPRTVLVLGQGVDDGFAR